MYDRHLSHRPCRHLFRLGFRCEHLLHGCHVSTPRWTVRVLIDTVRAGRGGGQAELLHVPYCTSNLCRHTDQPRKHRL